MVQFEVLESKLVYREINNRWYLLAQILLDRGEIYYVLTHSSNDREQKLFMRIYEAEDFKEFLSNWREKLLRNELPAYIELSTGTFVYLWYFLYISADIIAICFFSWRQNQ